LTIAVLAASEGAEKSVGRQKNKHTEILPCNKKVRRTVLVLSKRKLVKERQNRGQLSAGMLLFLSSRNVNSSTGRIEHNVLLLAVFC